MSTLSRFVALIATGLLVGPTSANAAMQIDQSAPASSSFACTALPQNLCGQSFQPAQSNIAGAGVFLAPGYGNAGYGTSGTVTINIFSSYGLSPTGLIATGTSGVVNTQSGWVDVFWSPVAVTPGTTYFLVLSSAAGFSPGLNYLPGGGPYASGRLLYNGGAPYPDYDLAFRTYYENAPVPLPAAAWLLVSGLGGLGFVGRRRKAA